MNSLKECYGYRESDPEEDGIRCCKNCIFCQKYRKEYHCGHVMQWQEIQQHDVCDYFEYADVIINEAMEDCNERKRTGRH